MAFNISILHFTSSESSFSKVYRFSIVFQAQSLLSERLVAYSQSSIFDPT